MTREDFVDRMVELGWTKLRDETGALMASFRMRDVTLEVLPMLRSCTVTLGPTLSRDDFDVAQTYISGRPKRIAERSIILQNKYRERTELTEKCQVKHYCDMMINWAQRQDIEAGLAVLRALPTDAKGAMPARHLAALAIHPDIEKLKYYRESFARGDRLNFVPYIDEGYIDRALEIAERRQDDPGWLPAKPKPRL